MDVSQAILLGLTQAISTFWYLFLIFPALTIWKSKWFKGVRGEFVINSFLRFSLPKNTYHLIKNVTLPTDDGTTQIDHIVVSKFGIFIIETKNMKGWIFGTANQKQWTQKIYRHTNKFQNPIHQNYKHLKTIEHQLEVPIDTIFSVVVFVGDCTFKTELPENVIYAGGCIRYIKSKTEAHFTGPQVDAYVAAIENGRLEPGLTTNLRHVKHVKNIVDAKQNSRTVSPDKAKFCEKCAAPMVLREAKKGAKVGNKFWGCSTFPKCRAVADYPAKEA